MNQIAVANLMMNLKMNNSKTIDESMVRHMIGISRAYIDNMVLHHPTQGNLHPTEDNINISQSWIVSQYKGEYNPWHQHSGHLSAVI